MSVFPGYGQEAVNRFYMDRPDLGGLYKIYLEYAGNAIDAMPEPRFAQHDPAPKVFSGDRFIYVFGPDTSHETHPLWQHWILDSFVEEDLPDLRPDKKYQLEITNLFHDTGEPFCAEKDVRFGSARDIKAETEARHSTLKKAFGTKMGGYIIDLSEPVLSGDDAEQAEYFKIVERMGYFTTGARAAQLYLAQHDETTFDLTPAERHVAGSIAEEVYRFQIKDLVAATKYSRVQKLLHAKNGIMRVAGASFRQSNI